jgi:hypothetical protein
MDYVMLICSDGVATEAKAEVIGNGIAPWIEQTTASGARKYGHSLMGPETAKTVRMRNGEALVSDGPFAESKEFIAGFDLIEADDLDAALAIAATHPVAQFHEIEVRAAHRLEVDESEFPTLVSCGRLSDAQHLDGVRPGKQRFLLFVCVNGIPESDEEEMQIVRDLDTWHQGVVGNDGHVFGTPLAHPDTATTVRVRNGETLLSDGPFTEAKEFIAGFYMFDVADEQEAIALAARHPIASYHRIEVRPMTLIENGCE